MCVSLNRKKKSYIFAVNMGNIENNSKSQFWVVTGIILLAVISRLVPHLPNFTPVTGIALFGACYFLDKKWAFIIPILSMVLSDAIIGFHGTVVFVYISISLITCIGLLIQNRIGVVSLVTASVASSLLFFIVTNFGVWLIGGFYEKTWVGLVTCYVAAIPFFVNTLLGDAFYVSVLFGVYALLNRRLILSKV